MDYSTMIAQLSNEELEQLKKEISSTIEKRKQTVVLEKLTAVRDALLELNKVAPYSCFTDSAGNQMGIHEIRKFFDTDSQTRIEINFTAL